MRLLASIPWLSIALSLGWSFHWLALSFKRWRLEAVCAYSCPPLMPADMVESYRRAFDWHTPMVWAALPLVVLPAVWLLRRRRAHRPG